MRCADEKDVLQDKFFTDEDISAVFRMFDVTSKGSISADQVCNWHGQ
jgi:Ca2+-binding EF-hand superfamily protein